MNIPSLLGDIINFTLSFHCHMLSPLLFLFSSVLLHLQVHVTGPCIFLMTYPIGISLCISAVLIVQGTGQDKILWHLACYNKNIFQIISFPCTIVICVYWTVFWIKFILDSWTLRMGPIGCPELSVRNYHYSLCNNPEEHISKFKWAKTCICFSNIHCLLFLYLFFYLSFSSSSSFKKFDQVQWSWWYLRLYSIDGRWMNVCVQQQLNETWKEETEGCKEKPVSVLLCQTQILHWLFPLIYIVRYHSANILYFNSVTYHKLLCSLYIDLVKWIKVNIF